MSQTPTKPERRRHPRAITSFSAALSTATQRYATRVINLSMGGALLDFCKVIPNPPIRPRDRVSVDIRRRGGAGPLLLEGAAVLWNVNSSSEPLLAVQFDEVDGDNADVLEELMDEALAEIVGRVPPKSPPGKRRGGSSSRPR